MSNLLKTTLLLALLLISPYTYATQEQDVLNWSEQTLMNTLTISYNQKQRSLAEVKKNYSYNAWTGIVGFFSGSMETIKKKRLILHPVIESSPQLLNSGVVAGIQFWRIQLAINVPELQSALGFTLLVINSEPASGSPYIIQNLNIKVTPL